ncbi:MAG: ABC transporter substrate-binding protein [Rhodospirillales bacterium]
MATPAPRQTLHRDVPARIRPAAKRLTTSVRLLAGVAIALLTIVPARARPERIVSINLCSDQLTLMLAPRASIRSLSYLVARPDASAFSDRVGDTPLNHGRAEEILPLAPDMILAGRYTSRPTIFLLQRLGYPVLDQDISRSVADVRDRVREVGRAIGAEAEAETAVADMDVRLADLSPQPGDDRRPTAIYYQPNGYTAGDDTLVGDIITHAGLKNLADGLGVRGHERMPLETLLHLSPDLLIFSDVQPQAPALAYEVLATRP